jgi:hypothetical protein
MRENPSARRDESPIAGRGLSTRMPAAPVLMSAKSIPANRKKRITSVTRGDRGNEPETPPEDVFPKTGWVISGDGTTVVIECDGADTGVI